ncbi:MAG: NAD-binding protein [Planctomycetota bacterium]
MRIVIVGAGSIGLGLAEDLARLGSNELVLVDTDEERCQTISGKVDGLVLHGDGTDPEMLEKAQIREAHALAACTGSDALNTVIAMLGHLAGVKKIVVKLDHLGLHAACQSIGVTRIVAPRLAATASMLSALYGTEPIDWSLISHGGLELAELPAGALVDKKLGDLELGDDALLVAVLRGQQLLLPRKTLAVETSDLFLALVEGDPALKKLRRLLQLEN